jgi:DNA-binding NarL/FixJ family response regulator
VQRGDTLIGIGEQFLAKPGAWRRLELEHQPFPLRALAAELQALFEPSAQAKGSRFEVAVDDACASHVLGDMHRVRQVLINLLGNAVKFTPFGAVTLELIAAPRGPGPAGIECVVSDNGIGIATRAIRADELRFGRSSVPLVALSANTQPSDVQESPAAGCVAHLGKPVDKAVRLAALHKHMAPRKARPAGEGELSAAGLAPPPSTAT